MAACPKGSGITVSLLNAMSFALSEKLTRDKIYKGLYTSKKHANPLKLTKL
jgi:hypothetical protein